jgi:oligopeptidase B
MTVLAHINIPKENKMHKQPVALMKKHTHIWSGNEISDDYHWMRDSKWPNVDDHDVLQYIKEENKYTDDFFDLCKDLYDDLYAELKGRIQLADQSTFSKKDDYYYYSRTNEDSKYKIYCRKHRSTSSVEEVILDINQLAADKNFTQVDAISVSPDHNLLAYSVDYTGAERYTIFVKNLTTHEHINGNIPDTIGDIVWHEDNSGFFYTPLDDKWRHNKVCFHALTDTIDNKNDRIILQEDNPLYSLYVRKSKSLEYIFITSSGHDSDEIYFIHMRDAMSAPTIIKNRADGVFYKVEHHDGRFFIHTNDTGPNFRIAIANVNTPEQWEEYAAQDDQKYLVSIDVSANYLVMNYKNIGLSEVIVQDFTTGMRKDVAFSEEAYYANSFVDNYIENDIRIHYSSLSTPTCTYRYHFENEERLEMLKQVQIPSGFDGKQYVVKRLWACNSDDNTKIPVSIIYHKEHFEHDGSNPLYLYGYGSYGIAMPMTFRSNIFSLVDRGFVFAIAHIRGGDDLGLKWYEDAKFLNKKKTLTDFISSAQMLIEERYTSEGNITICGGSAGGITVGYAINNNPDLFKVAIAHSPFVDVLNTMMDDTLPLTVPEYKEWGNPQDKDYFQYIRSYSPYDNVKFQNYPSIFITIALHDPRVGYWEGLKWAAKLRSMKQDKNLLLAKINTDASHTGASDRFDYLKEIAEEYAFILKMYTEENSAI